MLVGRRYRLALTTEQAAYAERVGAACRAVWNAALEQRQAAAQQRHSQRPTYVSQCHEVAEAKATEPWLAEAPSHCLQQTLLDLDRACRQHGTFRVHWRSKRRSATSFRFPDRERIGQPRRLCKRWAEVKLPKLGVVRFRWSRPLGGSVRNATVIRERQHWYVSFCVEDGVAEQLPNGLPPVGVDRGVVASVATSEGECLTVAGLDFGEHRRVRRLQQRLARQVTGSSRRRRTVWAIGQLMERSRRRRTDFAHQTAHRLTVSHGLVVLEDLRVQAMTRSAKGTLERPGRNVRQKTGLNRAILDKSWGQVRQCLEWHSRKNGCRVITVSAAYTSQTCSACRHVAAESRENQADFRCVACGHQANADINAAQVILAAGLAVAGRGDLRVTGSMKRQPPEQEVADAAP